MRRLVLRGLIASSLLVGCGHQAPAGGAWTTPSHGWSRAGAADLGLTVEMPGRPVIEESDGRTPDGTPLRTTGAVLTLHEEAVLGFIVSESMLPIAGDLVGELDGLDFGRLARIEGRIVADERFVHEGFPARGVVMEGQGVTLVARAYVGQRRVYTTFAVFPTQAAGRYDGSVRRYLDSVRLDPADAVEQSGDGLLVDRGWRSIHSPSSYFACTMPGAPRIEWSQARSGADSVAVQEYAVAAGDRSRSFVVRALHFGRRPEGEVLQSVRADLIAQGFDLIEETPAATQGFAGRHYVFESSEERVEVRTILTGVGVYELRARVALDEAERSRADSARFFRSFRVL